MPRYFPARLSAKAAVSFFDRQVEFVKRSRLSLDHIGKIEAFFN